MKNILIFLLILLPVFSFSQEDKIEYEKGKMELILLNEITQVKEGAIPFAKEVTVTYDPFYKSYYIYCLVDGGWSDFNLKYIRTYENGDTLCKDEQPSGEIRYYYVIDNSVKDGIILMTDQKPTDGMIKILKIYDLKLKK